MAVLISLHSSPMLCSSADPKPCTKALRSTPETLQSKSKLGVSA